MFRLLRPVAVARAHAVRVRVTALPLLADQRIADAAEFVLNPCGPLVDASQQESGSRCWRAPVRPFSQWVPASLPRVVSRHTRRGLDVLSDGAASSLVVNRKISAGKGGVYPVDVYEADPGDAQQGSRRHKQVRGARSASRVTLSRRTTDAPYRPTPHH